MTQNTQTTRERIAVLIHWEGIVEAPNIIAAEIDRLTAERDEARAQVIEARAMLLAEREAYSKRSAEQTIDGAVKLLTEELADARASLASCRANAVDGLSNMERNRNDLRSEVERLNTLRAKELAEARAEVERLRPAAKAWELQQRYAAMFADNLRGRVSDVDLACLEAEYEAARARAAKETP